MTTLQIEYEYCHGEFMCCPVTLSSFEGELFAQRDSASQKKISIFVGLGERI